MSSAAYIANQTIRGQRDAQRAIFTIREGCAPADALLDAFELMRCTGDADRLRGFAREVQKVLERSSGPAA